MRIGIDIDDVLTESSEKIKGYLVKYDKSREGLKHIVEVMRGDIPTEYIKQFYNEDILKMFKNLEIKEDAIDVINRLESKGHEIYFITSRGEQRFKGTEAVTLEFLEKNNIKYKKIIFNSYDKQIDCKNNNIEVMIDDSVKNCELVRNIGIPAILYTSEVNKNIDTDLERVNTWRELEAKIESL